MDVWVQVLVLWVVRVPGEAVSRHAVALAHSSLALVVGRCRNEMRPTCDADGTRRGGDPPTPWPQCPYIRHNIGVMFCVCSS